MTAVDDAVSPDRAGAEAAVVPLPSGAHELWPWAVVRSAGFPFQLWTRVHDDGLAEIADEALQAEAGPGGEAARDRLDEAVEEEWGAVMGRLSEAPEAADLACAVLWQNPGFYRTALRPALAGEVRKQPRKQRERVSTVISYLQRYIAKNDSVGFFGPVAWAPFVEDGPALAATPGESLVRRQLVKWESWGVQQLADALLAPRRLRMAVAPQLAPHVTVEQDRLRLPLGQTVALSPLQAAVMRRCDGDLTAEQIAEAIVGDPASPSQRPDDVYEVLEALEGRRWLRWSLNTGLSVDSEARLESLLAGVADSDETRRAREAYSSVAAVVGELGGPQGDERDPAILEGRLRQLGERFAEVTGGEAYRRQGETYAGRTPLCLEAERDVDVRLGPGFVDAVGPPLDLLMHSARWLIARAHDVFDQRLRATQRELAPDGGSAELVDLWMLNTEGWFDQELPAFLQPVVEEFQAKWADMLGYAGAEEEVRRRADELRGPVAHAFGEDGPATECFGQYASPDVMVCWPDGAPAPERYVLGELHLARNTTVTQGLLLHHQDRAGAQRLWERDHAAIRRVNLHGDDRATSNRLRPGVMGADDLEVRISPQSPHGREGAYRLGDFTVAPDEDGRLVATSRRDGVRVDLMRLVADAVELSCVNAFKLIPPSAHRPRIVIDDLVISRETWTLDRDGALGFALQSDSVERFLGARRLKAQMGLPRYVFAVYAPGAKPVLIDLDSVVSVDLLCRVVRRGDASTAIKVSEMLPRPEELWLLDRAGQRYTSELRMGVRSVPPSVVAAPR